MSLTFQFNSLSLSSPFLNGGPTSLSPLRKPSLSPPTPTTSVPITIRAMKTLQGRVVCSTNDKTVAVEVVRLAPHPKYKRRIRKKKIFQAHDPENMFEVGDFVQLEKSRPISKNKTFLAVPAPARNVRKKTTEEDEQKAEGDLGIPLESQSPHQS